jgi:gluconokinase
MNAILVLDIGSSSTRAILFDERGEVLPDAVVRQPVEFATDTSGASIDDPLAAWERVKQVLDATQAYADTHNISISAMGLSAYACSLLCLDERSNPLTPVFTYADTRSSADAHALRSQYDEMEALQRTGCRIRANYVPSRIAWIQRTMPDEFAHTRWYASLSDFICQRLFGVMRGGISVWSWSGLLNRDSCSWDAEWIKRLGITTEQLSKLAGDEWIEGLRPELRQRWPCLRAARCLPAIGDGAAANIGSGCFDDQHVAITIGSTGALRIVNAGHTSTLPAALWCYKVDQLRELIGGATTEGGNVFAWLRRSFILPEPAALEDALGALHPDTHRLTVLPLFAGERSPGYSENSRATIHGLTLDTNPVEIARACMEAIAYRLAEVYDSLSKVAKPNATLIASGGALLASPTWCQIIADVTGSPLCVCMEPEATSRGVALLVLERLGWIGSVAEVPARMGITFIPNTMHHTIYRDAQARQQELYRRLLEPS